MKRVVQSSMSALLIVALGGAIGLIGARSLKAVAPGYVEGDYSAQREIAQESAILLGTSWCGYCKVTREHLKARGVAFADLDVESSPMAGEWHRDLGAQGVPVILVGDRQIRGFVPAEIDDAIVALSNL